MAVSVFKTFSAGEILTAADLNSSFTQVTSNGEDLGWPATKAKDLDGQQLILDADGDTSITADTDDQIDFRIGGTDLIRFLSDGIYLNDSSNSNMTLGITLNQGANDDQIISLKSSDVAHGVTTVTETDTFGYIKKVIAATGGLEMTGIDDTSATGLKLQGLGAAANTTKTAAGAAFVQVHGYQTSGTGLVDATENANVFAIRTQTPADTGNAQHSIFIVDEDGDIFADGGTSTTAVTVFDGEDDISLVRAYDRARSRVGSRGFIKSQFDDFVSHNENDLVNLGVLGAPLSEGGLINVTRLQALHNGAIWQLYCRSRAQDDTIGELTRRLAIAEQRLAALPA